MCVSKTSDHIQIKVKLPNPTQKLPVSSTAPNEDLKDIDVLCTLKSRKRAKSLNLGVPKTSDHIKIKIVISNLSQEPPEPSKAPNQDFKDIDVLSTFKIKIESQNLDHGSIKHQWPYPNKDQDAKP